MKCIHPLIAAVLFIASCKKESEEPNSFSFTYKGQTHSDPSLGGLIYGRTAPARIEGIVINKPDVFGGEIRYYFDDNCAYLSPVGMFVYQTYGAPPCTLTDSGRPLDSVRVFWSQSVAKNYKEESCKQKEAKQLNGTTLVYDRCIYSGDFSITLKNKNDSLIRITGNFVKPLDKR